MNFFRTWLAINLIAVITFAVESVSFWPLPKKSSKCVYTCKLHMSQILDQNLVQIPYQFFCFGAIL